MEASITDAVTLERLATHFENWPITRGSPGTLTARCDGCNRKTHPDNALCGDCFNMVAAACRDAAGRVER